MTEEDFGDTKKPLEGKGARQEEVGRFDRATGWWGGGSFGGRSVHVAQMRSERAFFCKGFRAERRPLGWTMWGNGVVFFEFACSKPSSDADLTIFL
jgi:hypothetical protein